MGKERQGNGSSVVYSLNPSAHGQQTSLMLNTTVECGKQPFRVMHRTFSAQPIRLRVPRWSGLGGVPGPGRTPAVTAPNLSPGWALRAFPRAWPGECAHLAAQEPPGSTPGPVPQVSTPPPPPPDKVHVAHGESRGVASGRVSAGSRPEGLFPASLQGTLVMTSDSS